MAEDFDKDIEKAVPSIGELNNRIEKHEKTLKIAADEQLKLHIKLGEILSPTQYDVVERLATSNERSQSLMTDLEWIDALKCAGINPDDALKAWDEKMRIRNEQSERIQLMMDEMQDKSSA